MGVQSAVYEIIHETLKNSDSSLSVTALCEIAGVSRSGYYRWVSAEAVHHIHLEDILNGVSIQRQFRQRQIIAPADDMVFRKIMMHKNNNEILCIIHLKFSNPSHREIALRIKQNGFRL